MSEETTANGALLEQLAHEYLAGHPRQAARYIGDLEPDDAAELLRDQPAEVLRPLWQALPAGAAEALLRRLPDGQVTALLRDLDPAATARMLARMDESERSRCLSGLAPGQAGEIRELLAWPEGSAGAEMNVRVHALPQSTPIGSALQQLRRQGVNRLTHLLITDEAHRLTGQTDIARMVLADPALELRQVARPVPLAIQALEPLDETLSAHPDLQAELIPVIDIDGLPVGVIERAQVFESVKEDLVTDLQTMVGASPDERALSSSWFAIRKRLPWMQINLLTAFLASFVVGLFESTIATFTALAVLLPIAAGQSGNAGAQALAVTMRGLTLREITLSQWRKVVSKELMTGFVNGLAVAVTCGLGVYLWSRSMGLSLVIGMAMIISLVIACVAGALVPLLLKRFGQDPAQSSSIILTTITDIAGFLSFLGIATLLSGWL